MATPPPEEDHSFAPANHKLISVYLRRRISGEPLPSAAAAYFHEVDIYTAEPAALTAGLLPLPARKGEGSSWLFFTPVKTRSSTDGRRSRRVGGGGLGTWHSEHAPEAVIDDEGNRVGHRQLFSFKDKSGKRSGWSMWEFAADLEGGETLLVLCKIHQGHAGTRRADGSAARSARKRICTDDGFDKLAPAPVKRRLFVPHAPAPPAASQDEICATWEAVHSSTTKTQTLLDELDKVLDAVPMIGDETGASKDTPRSVMSILMPEPEAISSSRTKREASKDAPRSVMVWDGAYPLQPAKMSAASSSHGSFLPKPIAPWEWEEITSSTDEAYPSQPDKMSTPSRSHGSFSPKPIAAWEWEDITSSTDEACPSQPDKMSTTSRSHGNFSPKPIAAWDWGWEEITSSTGESPATFLTPESQASQGEMATFNCGFLMDSRAPSAPEYESFTDGSGLDISGVPQCELVSESSPWIRCDMLLSNPSVGSAFIRGFPSYLSGYKTMVSCSGNTAFIGSLPTYMGSGFSHSQFTGVHYGCGLPSTTFLQFRSCRSACMD